MTSDLETKWQFLCERWVRLGYECLTEDERVWFNLRTLIDAVENGGLISYFYNSGADTIGDCRIALRRLDAMDVFARVDAVAALFGSDVPAKVDERNRILDSWPDDSAQDVVLEKMNEGLIPLVSELDSKLDSFLKERGLVAHG
jgi:hypothetical protein